MTRAFFSLTFVLLCGIVLRAQFHALPQGHAVWAVSFWVGPGYPYELWMYELDPAAPDTVINGVPYEWMGVGAIRDDLAGRVYFVPAWADQEHLLYDYDVLPGDTIVYPPGVVVGDTLHVLAVDTVDIVGTSRKRITVSLAEQWSWGECYWVQGIGSMGGPLNLCQGPSVSGTSWLTCLTVDGIFQVGGEAGQAGDCSMYMGTEEIGEEVMNIYPNPVTDVLFVNGEGRAVRVELITADGRVMPPMWAVNGRMDVSDLVPGLYVLRTRAEDGAVRSTRFMKR